MTQTNNRSQRPLRFTSSASIHSFVHGNLPQVDSLVIPMANAMPSPSSYGTFSLFDRYNKTNLLLRDCESRDLNLVSKNIIVHE